MTAAVWQNWWINDIIHETEMNILKYNLGGWKALTPHLFFPRHVWPTCSRFTLFKVLVVTRTLGRRHQNIIRVLRLKRRNGVVFNTNTQSQHYSPPLDVCFLAGWLSHLRDNMLQYAALYPPLCVFLLGATRVRLQIQNVLTRSCSLSFTPVADFIYLPTTYCWWKQILFSVEKMLCVFSFNS